MNAKNRAIEIIAFCLLYSTQVACLELLFTPSRNITVFNRSNHKHPGTPMLVNFGETIEDMEDSEQCIRPGRQQTFSGASSMHVYLPFERTTATLHLQNLPVPLSTIQCIHIETSAHVKKTRWQHHIHSIIKDTTKTKTRNFYVMQPVLTANLS